jgi:hypothetical protein
MGRNGIFNEARLHFDGVKSTPIGGLFNTGVLA